MLPRRIKKIFIIVFILIVCIGPLFRYQDSYKRSYLKVLRKSGVIEHYDKYGKLNDKYEVYLIGKLYLKANFKSGVRNGWCIWYYPNGNKKQEIFYKNGKEEGIQNVYYSNGQLNYTIKVKNGKNYGSEYHYLPDRTLANYNAFDFRTGGDNCFLYVFYVENSLILTT